MYSLSDYDYDLPQELIAQDLASPADNAKLLVYDKSTWTIKDSIFHELPSLIQEWSHFFFNTSKVVKARIPIPKFDGEIFFLEQHTDEYTFDALVRPWKKMKVWTIVPVWDYIFEIVGMTEQWRVVRCSHPIFEVLEAIWQMPLPPYIWYDESKSDSYQPLQAKQPWSVAAPTASLHFTPQTYSDLKNMQCSINEVVLHIWLGTFKQVDTESIQDYDIHSEKAEVWWDIFRKIMTIKQSWKPLVAVGTTVTRTLETLPYVRKELQKSNQALECFDQETKEYWDTITKSISEEKAQWFVKSWSLKGEWTIRNDTNQWWYIVHPTILSSNITFESALYIYPWFDFLIIDQLITNFHLPKSSLLMLVAGFIWFENMKKIYEHAIAKKYMFYSFWDAMLIK